ncbi:hypothetical protein ACTFIU_006164 [Dictyostelium citrinum]
MKRFAAVLIGVSITGLAIPNINFNNSSDNNNNKNKINNKISKMNQNQNQNVKKVLISGASGFIGNALTKTLTEGNDEGNVNSKNDTRYEIYKLVRKTPTSMYEIEWNPDKQFIDKESLESLQPDVVIHLAGENILGIWTEEKKRKILESRTKGTTTLCEALSSISNPPKVFISASGCTYYGSNVYEPVDEYTPKGSGFFSDVVEKWEQSCDPLRKRNERILNQQQQESVNNSTSTTSSNGEVEIGPSSPSALKPTRIVNLRIGLVMDKAGGLLGSMYYPFLFGLGGVIGSGKQYLPWVSLRDAISVIKFAIENDQVNGPINVVSINPATNYEFTKTLGNVLNRPTIFWIPETPLRYILGKDMSEETVLSSQRVLPRKLLDYGFRFQDTNLTATLDRIVNEKK